MARSRGTRTQAKRRRPRVLGPLSVLAQRLILISGIVSAATAAYLIYGVAAGHLSHFPLGPGGRPLPLAAREHLQQVVTMTTQVMLWAGWVAMLLTIARYPASEGPLYVLAAAGAICYLGLPFAVTKLLTAHGDVGSPLTLQVVIAFLALGKTLLLVAAIWLMIRLVVGIWRRPALVRTLRAPIRLGKPVLQGRSLLGACWELSRCSSFLHSTCPNLRDHRTCWKRASGCYCDEKLAKRVMESRDQTLIHEIAALLSHAATLPMRPGPHAALTGGERLCHRCPIYLEHQERKYRSLYWLAYPTAAGLILALLGPLHGGYVWFIREADQLMQAISFAPPSGSATDPWTGLALTANFEWVAMGVLGLIVVTYLLQGIEYCIFEWKI